MKKIKLIKMGMDFYDDEDTRKSDMGNHRLRVQVVNEAPTDAEQRCGGVCFTDKDGHEYGYYVALEADLDKEGAERLERRLNIAEKAQRWLIVKQDAGIRNR